MKWPTAEVLWVARYDYYEGWGMNIPHEHDYHQIMYIIDGVGRFSLGEEQHEILPERMFFNILDRHFKNIFCFIGGNTIFNFETRIRQLVFT